jgi:hypothetical protein
MIYYALAASVIINLFLLWFCYKLLRNLLTLSENAHDILDEVDDFGAHLDSVHEMTMYFGDETLGALLKHSRDLRDSLGQFVDSNAVDLEIDKEQHEEEETDQEEA